MQDKRQPWGFRNATNQTPDYSPQAALTYGAQAAQTTPAEESVPPLVVLSSEVASEKAMVPAKPQGPPEALSEMLGRFEAKDASEVTPSVVEPPAATVAAGNAHGEAATNTEEAEVTPPVIVEVLTVSEPNSGSNTELLAALKKSASVASLEDVPLVEPGLELEVPAASAVSAPSSIQLEEINTISSNVQT